MEWRIQKKKQLNSEIVSKYNKDRYFAVGFRSLTYESCLFALRDNNKICRFEILMFALS
jgi:hypothetical protein